MIEKKNFVGLYFRVSNGKQVNEGFSLEAQEEVTLDVAKKRFGSNVGYELYVDSKETKNRPELDRMMCDVKKGRLAAVITFKVSRLSRSFSDVLKLIDQIHQAGADFISVKEGEYGTFKGNLHMNILSSIVKYQRDELESKRKTENRLFAKGFMKQ
ncbi:recombinase family protein [Paenibacillus sp. S-38]|uniref:recombinase family protein n=1 Tax=Paenibacillus sp. S-38 TaxID=3416710 RepID=UPI003CF00865